MRRLRYNQSGDQILFFWITAFMLVAVLMNSFVYAEDKPNFTDTHKNKKNEKLHITADKLISDHEAKYAEFIGNVMATQRDTVITADKLKIFFKRGMDNKKNPLAGDESIKKIVANGNVQIKFDNRVAVTQQAVYITETRVLVLSGADSKVISGNNSISGEKITVYRTDGRIQVESGKGERVEAVLYPGEKGIN
jgi:lipopolysaccharide export system protein LptA